MAPCQKETKQKEHITETHQEITTIGVSILVSSVTSQQPNDAQRSTLVDTYGPNEISGGRSARGTSGLCDA